MVTLPETTEALKAVTGKSWTFFGTVGTVLFLIAALDGIPGYANKISSSWQASLAGIACVFIVMTILIVLREQKPTIAVSNIDWGLYSVIVHYPENNDAVKVPFTLSGILSNALPGDVELWFCTVNGEASTMFWPQTKARITNTSWSCHISHPWIFENRRASYRFLLVGKNGQKHIALYQKLNQKYHAATGEWGTCIDGLLDDMVPCTDVRKISFEETI